MNSLELLAIRPIKHDCAISSAAAYTLAQMQDCWQSFDIMPRWVGLVANSKQLDV
jgi:hypothetical protein